MKTFPVLLLSATLALGQSQEELMKMKRAAEAMFQMKYDFRSSQFEFKTGVTGPLVKGQPYSAAVLSETTQALADGNRIHREESYNIYRDFEGRIRRDTASGTEYSISDPVAGASYIVNERTKTARKMPLARSVTTNDKLAIEAKMRAAQSFESPQGRIEVTMRDPAVGQVKHEDLGIRTIDGVLASGTRMITAIAAGAVGNDLPLQIVDERWFSPDLQVTLMTQHSDPRSGTSSYRLTRLSRSAPAPSLFEVPAGYQIVESK